MNSYLLRQLTQLNSKLSDVRKFSVECDRLQSELKEMTSKRDEAMKSTNIDEACELLELTNQLEGTHFVLDVSSYVVEERTSVDPTEEDVKEEPKCVEDAVTPTVPEETESVSTGLSTDSITFHKPEIVLN